LTHYELHKFWIAQQQDNNETYFEKLVQGISSKLDQIIVAPIPPIELVLFDIASVAPVIAKQKLQVPSICLSNFTWDWIYNDPYYVEKLANDELKLVELKQIIGKIQDCFKQATAIFRLPYHHEEMVFPKIVDTTYWISMSNDEALSIKATAKHMRTRLIELYCSNSSAEAENTSNVRFMLFSFGGHAFPLKTLTQDDFAKWKVPKPWKLVFVSREPRLTGTIPTNVINLTEDSLSGTLGGSYSALVAAMDCTCVNIGYGIVNECLTLLDSTRQVVMYTDRFGFREYKLLVKAMSDNSLQLATITAQEVMEANASVFERADELLVKASKIEFKQPTFACNGAEQIAKQIVAYK